MVVGDPLKGICIYTDGIRVPDGPPVAPAEDYNLILHLLDGSRAPNGMGPLWGQGTKLDLVERSAPPREVS